MMNERAYWICQITGWTIYLIASLGFAMAFQRYGWKSILSTTLSCTIGFILSHAFRAMVKRYKWTQLPLLRLVPRVILANIIIAFLWLVFASILIFVILRVADIKQYSFNVAVVVWFNWSATIFIWSLIYFGVHFFVNYKQAEIRQW